MLFSKDEIIVFSCNVLFSLFKRMSFYSLLFYSFILTLSLRLVQKPTLCSNFFEFFCRHATLLTIIWLLSNFRRSLSMDSSFWGKNRTTVINFYCSLFYTCSKKLVKCVRKKGQKSVRTVKNMCFYKYFLNCKR